MITALPRGRWSPPTQGSSGTNTWKARSTAATVLFRVGANVRLLKDLGYVKERNGLVYLWPDREAETNRRWCCDWSWYKGKHPVYLVTSVLDEATLSDKQVVDSMPFAGQRLFYRHFKQTFERRKLRSRSADNAELEGTWSLLGLWAMSLHAQVELAMVSRHDGSAWPKCCGRIGNRSANTRALPTRGIVARTRVEGRDRPLQASEQVQPRLSSQARPRDRRSRNP